MRRLGKYADTALAELADEVRKERLRRAGAVRRCLNCHIEFVARAGASYCSGRCRTAAYRRRLQGAA